MKVNFTKFAGILPKIKPRNLPKQNAVEAHNCMFQGYSLSSNYDDVTIKLANKVPSGTKQIKTFEVQGREFFAYFYDYVDTIPAFEDLVDRIYYSIRGGKMYVFTQNPKYISQNFLAGVPKPKAVINVIKNQAHEKAKDHEETAYRFSLVDQFGNEGALSDPSKALFVSESEFRAGQTITLNISKINLPTAYNIDPTKLKIRIYRANTGTQTTYWQYITEKIINVYSHHVVITDSTPSSKLQEVAITENWLPPGEDIQHLITDGKGRACIAYKNIVSISVQNVPTAFPPEHKYYIPEGRIVGLAAVEQGVLVFTTINIYLLAGDNPQALSTILLFSKLPCVSKLSITKLKDRVFFASDTSIVVIENNKYLELTENVISRNVWQDLDITNSIGFEYKNNYILKTKQVTLEVSLTKEGIDLSTLPNIYKCITKSSIDKNYLCLTTDLETKFFRYSEDHAKATWRSKIFRSTSKIVITCGKIAAEVYPVKLSLIRKGVFIYSQEIHNSDVFRINFPVKTSEWQFQLDYKGDIFQLTLASSIRKLSGEIE